jgi:hypothetical protein
MQSQIPPKQNMSLSLIFKWVSYLSFLNYFFKTSWCVRYNQMVSSPSSTAANGFLLFLSLEWLMGGCDVFIIKINHSIITFYLLFYLKYNLIIYIWRCFKMHVGYKKKILKRNYSLSFWNLNFEQDNILFLYF